MNQFAYKKFYRRNLTHVQPEGATLFITFRLANSLPQEVIERLRTENGQVGEKINQIADEREYKNDFSWKIGVLLANGMKR